MSLNTSRALAKRSPRRQQHSTDDVPRKETQSHVGKVASACG